MNPGLAVVYAEFQPRKREAASLALGGTDSKMQNTKFQPRKREAASLALWQRLHTDVFIQFQPRKREAASLAKSITSSMHSGSSFQPRKREAASLAVQRQRVDTLAAIVSTPQAGSGLFSLLCF